MKVKDVMTTEVVTVKPSTGIREIYYLFRKKKRNRSFAKPFKFNLLGGSFYKLNRYFRIYGNKPWNRIRYGFTC